MSDQEARYTYYSRRDIKPYRYRYEQEIQRLWNHHDILFLHRHHNLYQKQYRIGQSLADPRLLGTRTV